MEIDFIYWNINPEIINMGQLLSIPFILVGLGFVIYGLQKTKKDKERDELLTTID